MHGTSTTRQREQRARWAWIGGIAAMIAAVLAGCASQHGAGSAAAPSPSELRVGIAPNSPPLAFKRKGAITGVEAQFARKLGPALGVKVALVDTPWEGLIPALLDHRIDIIMSGMSITPERKQLVSFVHPYLRIGQMLVLRRADADRLRDDAAINQPATRVGFVTGTTGAAYVGAHFQQAQRKGFESVDAAVAALRAGDIDVFVHDSPSIWRVTAPENDPQGQLVGRYEPRTVEYLAWAVRRDDTELRARLNTVLAEWNTDGTLDDLLRKWIEIRRSPPAAH